MKEIRGIKFWVESYENLKTLIDELLILFDFVKELDNRSIGEVVLNSIDRDGEMNGYDLTTIEKVRSIFRGPMTVMGGAGQFKHIQELVSKFPIIGAAAGSLFVFKGKYKAVLINYPSHVERCSIYQNQN